MSIFTSLNYQHGYSSCYYNCKICFSHLMNFIFINFVFQEKSNSHGFNFLLAQKSAQHIAKVNPFSNWIFSYQQPWILSVRREWGEAIKIPSSLPSLKTDSFLIIGRLTKIYEVDPKTSEIDSKSSEDFRGWPEGLLGFPKLTQTSIKDELRSYKACRSE